MKSIFVDLGEFSFSCPNLNSSHIINKFELNANQTIPELNTEPWLMTESVILTPDDILQKENALNEDKQGISQEKDEMSEDLDEMISSKTTKQIESLQSEYFLEKIFKSLSDIK